MPKLSRSSEPPLPADPGAPKRFRELMTTGRQVLHMDLDAFFVACELLRQPQLAGKPVIIGGTGRRGVVASCSYAARKFGVHSAMPIGQARQRCPQAVCLPGDMAYYSAKSREVRELVEAAVPLCEFASIDEFYCDLTGMDRFFGCWRFSRELRQRLQRETGLALSMGLSTSKTVAKIAAGHCKPNGELHIARGQERAFLVPLPIEKIPSLGKKTSEILRNRGICHVRDLQETSPELLRTLLGKHGPALWKKANGYCTSPVEPAHVRKSIGTERTFGQDTADPAHLHRVLIDMTERVSYQLRQKGNLAGCVTLKLRYHDFTTHTRQQKLPYTDQETALLPVVHRLFEQLFDRKHYIRLVGVRLSDLVRGGHQAELFRDTDQQLELLSALDDMKRKYGIRAVRRAAGQPARKRSLPPRGAQ